MNKYNVNLIDLESKETISEDVMEYSEIPKPGNALLLDEGIDMFVVKFSTEDEENHSVNLYGEIKLVEFQNNIENE